MDRFVRSAMRLALVVLTVGAVLGTTGCSWFHRGEKDDADGATAVQPPGAQAPTTQPVPPSQEAEGPRPGDLVPLPEMQTIYFDYDRANIRPDQLEAMEANLAFLKASADVKVYITGHTDERGTVEYNYNLGMRRAGSVRDYYVEHGIAAERFAITSKGEEEPEVAGTGETAWAKNRRAQFQRMY